MKNNFKTNKLTVQEEMINTKEFNNYYITLDGGSCGLYMATNAKYEEAYRLFEMWFLKERDSGDYEDLYDYVNSKGYKTRINRDVEEAIIIDLNRVIFE